MSPESRYRRLLRLLPTWYRDRYEDEMVEVHRASGAPLGVGEAAATARLAVTTRARAVGRPSATTSWLIAVAVVTALAAQALWGLWVFVNLRFVNPPSGWSLGPDGRLVHTAFTPDLSDVIGANGLYRLVWLVALVLILAGLRRAGLVTAVVVAILDVSAGLGPLLDRDSSFFEVALARTDARAALLPIVAVGVLVLIPLSRGAAPAARQRLLAAGATAALLVLSWGTVRTLPGELGDGTAWSMLVQAVVVASLGALVLCRRIDPAWPAAVLTLAAVALLAGPLPHAPLVGTGRPIAGVMVWAVVAVLASGTAWVAATGRRAPEHVTGGTSRRAVAG